MVDPALGEREEGLEPLQGATLDGVGCGRKRLPWSALRSAGSVASMVDNADSMASVSMVMLRVVGDRRHQLRTEPRHLRKQPDAGRLPNREVQAHLWQVDLERGRELVDVAGQQGDEARLGEREAHLSRAHDLGGEGADGLAELGREHLAAEVRQHRGPLLRHRCGVEARAHHAPSSGGSASPKASGPRSPSCLWIAADVAFVTPSDTGSTRSNQRGMVASTHSARLNPVARQEGAPSAVTSSSHSTATATASSTARAAPASCTSLPCVARTCLRATSVARSRAPVGDCWAAMNVPSCARIAALVAGSDGSTPMLRIAAASSGFSAAWPSTCSSIELRLRGRSPRTARPALLARPARRARRGPAVLVNLLVAVLVAVEAALAARVAVGHACSSG